MVAPVIGTPGVNGTNSASPTAGKKGGAATYTYSGHIGADSQSIEAVGGTGGTGGNNTGTGNGAAGGDGGDASITFSGNIYSPLGSDLQIIGTAVGGTGGAGGTGAAPGAQGNGGNATVAISGNIISTSKLLSDITIDALAVGGTGTKFGNATASITGNTVTYSNTTATNVVLDAAALLLSGDSVGNNPALGTKTATVSGNIITGNVNNLDIFADAYYSNGTATISGNILTAKPANTGNVELEALGQKISITGNILNLGKQELDINIDELGPTYGATLSGNIFNGTGSNTLVFSETQNPSAGPTTDTLSVNLAANTLTYDGQSNIINKFASFKVNGSFSGNFIGTSGNNVLDASGDTTTGTIIFMGNGGMDTITGGPNALNVADFAGTESQYTTHTLTSVIGGPAGNTSNDTLSGIQRLKFLAPSHVSDLDNNGFGDLVFQNSNNQNIQFIDQGPGATTGTITGIGANFKVIGTGQFTADTDRNAGILLQNSNNGNLEVITNVAGTPTNSGPLLGGGAGVTATTFTGWTAITAGDFNGDAASDVLLQQGAGGPVEIAFMNTAFGEAPGTIDQISAVTSPTGGNWNAVSSGDFNGDGYSDILWQNSVSGALDVSLMNGATGTPVSIGTAPTGYTAIGTGDFNDDGKSDILFQNTTTGAAEIWTMNGTAQTGSPITVAKPGANFVLLGAEDVNGDGFSDLLWQNTNNGNVTATEMTTGGAVLATVALGAPNNNNFHLIASTGGG